MGGYPTKNDNCPYFSYICPANKTIYRYEKSFLGRIAESVNVDAKFNVDISDDTINNLFLIATGLVARFFTKK